MDRIIFFLITLFLFFKTVGYGVYELKNNQNKFAGITIFILSLISIVFSNIIFYIR